MYKYGCQILRVSTVLRELIYKPCTIIIIVLHKVKMEVKIICNLSP